ncbi:protein NLRC5-like [Acanthaster planci]|uniref:Protein NLRC5-like n=1 Tax=Acanthaster planci TaxID=133434 RepID=A0A8B7XHH7_ACAPL|nr:protein NLRC5-like [Acanthaster planci]
MQSTLDEVTLRYVASHLGKEWKALATYLGVRNDEVDRIQASHRGTEEQIFQMLMTWCQRWDTPSNHGGKLSFLRDCLIKSKRSDLAESLLDSTDHLMDWNFNRCCEEFIEYYRNTMGVVALLPWVPSEVSKVSYIGVKLQFTEQAKKAGRLVKFRNIDSYEDLLRLEYHDSQPVRFILLSGIAGSGKTTVVSTIATDWASKKRGSPLSNFSLLIALSVRELKRAADLGEAIFDQILAKDTTVSLKSLINRIQSHAEEVLVVLDGADEFDEDGSQLPSEGDIIGIISNKILRGCTVIVTTRPHTVDKLCELNPSFIRVEISGFSDSGVKEYIQNFFKGYDPKVSAALDHQLIESEGLYSLAKIPMMLLLICLIWSEENELPETLTELFKEAALFMLKRYSQRTGNHSQEEQFLESEWMEFVQALGKTALDGVLLPGQKLVLKPSDFENSQMVDKACSVGILSKEKVRSKLSSVQHVTFFHKTFQEAIAGFYWASLVETDGDSFNRYRKQISEENSFNLEYVLRFCCGANVKAAKSLLTHVTDCFSTKCSEPAMTTELKNVPNRIILKPVSSEEIRGKKMQRLWLMMHFEAHSRDLHSIDKPMDRHKLKFDFDCTEEERNAFGFLVDCASSVCESFLNEIHQVSMSSINEKSAPVVATILKQGMVNIRDINLQFGESECEEAGCHWQMDLGYALSKIQLRNLSLSGHSLLQKQDISAIFGTLNSSAVSYSLETLTLSSVAFNPRYLKEFLEKQSMQQPALPHSQTYTCTNTCDRDEDLEEASKGLPTGSLKVLDVRHCQSDSSAFCLKRPFPNLQVLRLIDDGLQEEDMWHINSLLSRSPMLLEVDFSRNNIGHGFMRLTEQLSHLGQLQVLKLTDTGLNSDQFVHLARQLRVANLRVLSLSCYKYSPKTITAEALLAILQWSCMCSSLKELDVKQCVREFPDVEVSADPRTAQPIEEILQSSMENLDLSSNRLGKYAPQIIKLFSYMPSLKNLDMSGIGLTYPDAVLLVEVLPSCQRMQELHVGDNNKMGNSGLEALLKVTPKLPDLNYLSLPDKDGEPPEMVRECLRHGHRYSIIRYFYQFNRPQIAAVVEVIKRFEQEGQKDLR